MPDFRKMLEGLGLGRQSVTTDLDAAYFDRQTNPGRFLKSLAVDGPVIIDSPKIRKLTKEYDHIGRAIDEVYVQADEHYDSELRIAVRQGAESMRREDMDYVQAVLNEIEDQGNLPEHQSEKLRLQRVAEIDRRTKAADPFSLGASYLTQADRVDQESAIQSALNLPDVRRITAANKSGTIIDRKSGLEVEITKGVPVVRKSKSDKTVVWEPQDGFSQHSDTDFWV